MMSVQLDQAISTAITETLRRSQLSPEMLRMIKSSLNADSKTGELFKWAHLTLLNCECVSGEKNVGLSGAIAMELFALAADIFDDIQDQDNDDLPWREIPNANSINLATCLLMLAYESIATIPDSRLFRVKKKKDFVNNRKTLPYVYLLNILKGNPAADRFKELSQRESKELDRFGSEEQDYLRQLTFNEGAVHYCKVMYELFRQKAMEIIKAMPIPENHKEKMIKIC